MMNEGVQGGIAETLTLLRVYFQKYTQSTPKIHHEYRTDTHGVIWKFFQKGVLVYFFTKNQLFGSDLRFSKV